MSKYSPFEMYLKSARVDTLTLTFAEIESIIKDQLPPSARKHHSWWTNNTTNNAMAQSWITAEFEVAQVNMIDESLVFIRAADENASEKSSNSSVWEESHVHPAFGCLRGTVTISPDTDLTAPAMSEWAEIAMNDLLLDTCAGIRMVLGNQIGEAAVIAN